ncbi:FAD/NAD(P)-binding protein [Raoultella terrigena]|uniref:FAD/NAD(P)-binding protein n=1 Tax=Raoultella terrigena TaxID=577 RepID=UPI0005F76E8A|nr:FAD/NAD(P)-binding protein [Raoultella terrigena]
MKKQHNAILHIGIVGGGPRGLVVLERLTHYATKYDIPLVISIIDPQQPGAGVHSPSLPEYKMLNTVAGQITLFPDETMLSASEESRPVCTFIEWCRQHKSLPDFWYTHENRRLCSWDFLPRSWLGEYLQWAYDHIVSQAGPEVTVRHIPAAAVDIDRITDQKFMISLSNEEILHVDAVYLTTGHGQGAEEGEGPEYIAAGASVLLQGMGLTAIDTIADWTTGRGGHFRPRSGGIPEYIPSGKEPEIFLTSRSGLPFRCRPESLTLGGNITRDAVIFRTDRVQRLKDKLPTGIDFEHQVLPLIRAEMQAAYYSIHLMKDVGADKAVRFREALRKAESWTEINGIMQNAVSRYGEFNEEYLLAASLPREVHPNSYATWLVNEMAEDLNESITGVTHSPVKAANEVWRNCRHQLRIMMDDSGLSDASRTFFYTRYAPVINRLVAGPQKERHQELLALIRAGVVKPLHPDVVINRRYDHAIQALIQSEKPGLDMPPLVKKMVRKGLLTIKTSGRTYVDVRADGRPSALKPKAHMWVFGPLCEGATYYNHYVPSPGSFSRSSNDADRSTRELLILGGPYPNTKITVPADRSNVSLSDKSGSSEIQL